MKNKSLKKILLLVNKYYSRNIECLPYIHWFNPFQTVYLNFRSFPLHQAWKLPVVVYGRLKIFSLSGQMRCEGECKTFMIEINRSNMGEPSKTGGNTEIKNDGTIIFQGKCQIYTDNKIGIHKGAVLELGRGTRIMSSVNIGVFSRLGIGEQSWITHRCQVMDSNYHYIADFKHGIVKRPYSPIEIGTYCWICNSTTITGGTILPNKTIVASNSLVNRDMSDIPEESIIGGQPAKLLSSGYRKVENGKFIKELDKWFSEHTKESVFYLEANCDHSICDIIN